MAVVGVLSGIGCGFRFVGLGLAEKPASQHEHADKPQPTKPAASLGIKFPELGFWFWVFWVPGRMGAAGLKLQLSTYEAWLRWGID